MHQSVELKQFYFLSSGRVTFRSYSVGECLSCPYIKFPRGPMISFWCLSDKTVSYDHFKLQIQSQFAIWKCLSQYMNQHFSLHSKVVLYL